MSLIVQKFGGTSVRDAERINNVADIFFSPSFLFGLMLGGAVPKPLPETIFEKIFSGLFKNFYGSACKFPEEAMG